MSHKGLVVVSRCVFVFFCVLCEGFGAKGLHEECGDSVSRFMIRLRCALCNYNTAVIQMKMQIRCNICSHCVCVQTKCKVNFPSTILSHTTVTIYKRDSPNILPIMSTHTDRESVCCVKETQEMQKKQVTFE